MGLSNVDWLVSLSFGLGLIFVVLVLLLLVRATVDLTEPSPHSVTDHVQDPNTGETSGIYGRANIAWQMIGASVLLSGIEEFHWSFFRGAIWEIALVISRATCPASILGSMARRHGSGARNHIAQAKLRSVVSSVDHPNDH